MTPLDLVLERLAQHGNPAKKVGKEWAARCPAHADSTPSLSINEGRERNAVLHCHAGCPIDDILRALNLTAVDLFPPKERTSGLGDVIARYTYEDADGQPVLRVLRFHPKTFRQQHWNGSTWVNGRGDTAPLLYRLPSVRREADAGGTIWLAEGEKDVHALENAGVVATCNAQGAGKFYADHAAQLHGAGLVMIVADNDDTGRAHAATVAALLDRVGIANKTVLPAAGKDAFDHLSTGHGIDEFVPVVNIELDATPEPPADSDTDEEQSGHGWEPVDLATVLAADYTPPKPTVLLRIDGAGLLYPGRMNAIYGESGSGKSWVAMAACAQILDAGGCVVYVDLEDHAASVVARMIALGVDQRTIIERFTYINPLGAWNRDVSEYLVDHCEQRSVELVVIDSTGEAMALDGAKPNDDDDTARWFRRIPRTLARTGAAVLLLDHMPKSTDANQGFAIGSQRKRAAIDGASYRVEVGVAPAKGVDGHLRLITAKDRGGTYQHGHKAAEVDIVDSDGRTVVTIKPPGTGLPTVLMGRICQFLEAEGVSTSRQITRNVSGKDTAVANALNILVDRGYVERSVRQGKSGGFDHRLVRHFTELDGFDPTPETEPLPALPNRGPAEGQHLQDLTVAPLPRIHTNAGHGPRLDAPEGITKTPRVAPPEGNGWNHPEEPALAPTGTEPTQPVKGPF